MPAVIFFACLDLEQKSTFMDGHELEFVYYFGFIKQQGEQAFRIILPHSESPPWAAKSINMSRMPLPNDSKIWAMYRQALKTRQIFALSIPVRSLRKPP